MVSKGYYEGTFVHGEIEGHGFKVFGVSGATYTGQFHLGELHGQGLMRKPDGELGAIIQEKVCNLKSVKSGVSVCMSVCVCVYKREQEREKVGVAYTTHQVQKIILIKVGSSSSQLLSVCCIEWLYSVSWKGDLLLSPSEIFPVKKCQFNFNF